MQRYAPLNVFACFIVLVLFMDTALAWTQETSSDTAIWIEDDWKAAYAPSVRSSKDPPRVVILDWFSQLLPSLNALDLCIFRGAHCVTMTTAFTDSFLPTRI